MAKTITVFDWHGGGTWGLHQLIFAHYLEEMSGLRISDMADVNFARSVGTVGAIALGVKDENNPTRPAYTAGEVFTSFYKVAVDLFGSKDLYKHRARAVEHDLHHLQQDSKRHLFRKSPEDGLHYNHALLAEGLKGALGDIKLKDLLHSTIILSQHFETSATAAHAYLDPTLFNEQKWKLMKNWGADISVSDAIMCSTAAPTVFNAYSPDKGQNHFVDNAFCYGPTDTLLNLAHMHDGEVKFHLVTLGTGDTSKKTRNAMDYVTYGFLRMGDGLLNGIARESIANDYNRTSMMFPSLSHTVLDTDLSLYPDINISPFMGKPDELNMIIDIAVKSAQSQHDVLMQTIDDICETKIRESMPQITSNRVTEMFYRVVRKKAETIVPESAKPFEHARTLARATDITTEATFNAETLKTQASNGIKLPENKTQRPQTAIERVLSFVPMIGKKEKIPQANKPMGSQHAQLGLG